MMIIFQHNYLENFFFFFSNTNGSTVNFNEISYGNETNVVNKNAVALWPVTGQGFQNAK